MILGTHNTMTYKTPEQWYLKPLFFIARCQKYDWAKQYRIGTRWFDIRLKYDNQGDLHFGHGIFSYNANDFDDFLYFMNNRINPIYMRIVFEERSYNYKSSKRNYKIECFAEKCKEIENKYPNIHFFCGESVYTKEILYQFKENSPITEEYYSSVTSLFKSQNKILKIIDDWCPWIYARINTKRLYRKYLPYEGYIALDFVNMLV